jgi:beta-1,4-mannosyltransferase
MHLVLALALPPLLLLLLAPCLAASLHVSATRARLQARRDALSRRDPRRTVHAAVVSASPASHSPRALNHALSLARTGRAAAVFHAHTPCPSPLPPGASFLPISAAPRTPGRLGLLRAVAAQAAAMYASLIGSAEDELRRYDVIVVNSPPCIPAFAVTLLAARVFHRCPVIVDWHNFGYTIMQTTGASGGMVRVARALEWAFGRQMDGHFCVSRAMGEFLRDEWAIDARVLYDRPRDEFQPVKGLDERHRLFCELHRCAEQPVAKCSDGGGEATFATERRSRVGGGDGDEGEFVERADRPALLVSSTSWTPDEDFDMLLDALVQLDARLAAASTAATLPFGGRLVVAITGRGPLREAFEARIDAANLSTIAVWFAWLSARDYPRLLGCADLGVCLHTSSSGLDLPMKVADMLGCGLPVAAARFRCIGELVRVGETGALFDDARELAARLWEALFAQEGAERRRRMRESVTEAFAKPAMRWHATWEHDALPLIDELCGADGAVGRRREA